MKKLMIIALAVVVIIGIILPVSAVPTVPPVPEPTPEPSPPPGTPEPTQTPSGGGIPFSERQQKFEVISAEPIMEGYAGGTIDYSLKVIQKGYPELEVHLEAEIPENWKASFSKNDFTLSAEETVELKLSLSPPDSLEAEKHEIKIRAEGEAVEDSVKVKDSETVTAMTYLIDVGVVNLQVQPPQPEVGQTVTVSVTTVNYTQRQISNIAVEFMVNNNLTSRQTLTLSPGVSQQMTFGWTAQSGTSTLLVRTQTAGDNNRRNDSTSLSITLGDVQVETMYNQAVSLFSQGKYSQAASLFAQVAAKYTEAGNVEKAMEASQMEELSNSYVTANNYMNQGEQAFQLENYEQAAQYFEQARGTYAEIGDPEKESLAKQRRDEALEAQKPAINKTYVGLSIIGVVAVILIAMLLSRRRSGPVRPVEQTSSTSRFRLEESARFAPSQRPTELERGREPEPERKPEPVRAREPVGRGPPELVEFHQKTEEALSRFTKGYIRDNLQQAMRVYLSLEAEKKQLPRGKDLELERIINTNLKELEHRIFGTF
jgi:tetratricopeptide (TPR) repeat protein